MYEYYTAVLGAVREGLLLLDTSGRVQLVNDEARRLLDLPDDVVGRPIGELGLAPGLVAAALGRTAEADDLYLAGDRVLVVSSSPATWEGADVGAVVTLRDHTELRAVTGELDVVRGLSDSLRAQNHESANRLHTIVSLIELGRVEEAVDFATEELQVAQLLTDQVVGAVGDPVVEALLLGKSADAAERGVELRIRGTLPPHDVPARDLVTVLGNLVDNALDAVVSQPTSASAGSRSTLGSTDHGRGQRPRPGRRGHRARPRARLDAPRAAPATASASRWSRRSRAGTAARSRSAAPSSAARGSRWTPRMSVRVLVVEDEATAAEAHGEYVGRMPGFELAGTARSAHDAARFLDEHPDVDLVPARHAPARRPRPRPAPADARRRPPLPT